MMRDFIRIQTTLIPTPASWSISYENLEDTTTSEAGTDRTVITRLLKPTYNFTFQVTEFWAQKLLAFAATPKVSLTIGSRSAIYGRFRITAQVSPERHELGLWTLTAKFTGV